MISDDINKTHYDKPIQARVAVVQELLAKYEGKRLNWGKIDCFRMVAFTLKRLGHPLQLSKIKPYSDIKGALRVLRDMGYSDLKSAMDDHLFPIGAASVLPADIVGLPGEDGWMGLCVVIGNGRVFGFTEDYDTAQILQPTMIPEAWRTPVKDLRRRT